MGSGVAIIQPGLIRRSSRTPRSPIDEATAGEGPYAEFNRSVAEQTTAIRGADGTFLLRPRVGGAGAIEKAIASRPKPRYVITAGARVMLVTRAARSPDRGWDAMMRGAVPAAGQGLAGEAQPGDGQRQAESRR